MTTAPAFPGISRFGQTAAGEGVERIVLSDRAMTVALLTYGATLQGLWLRGLPYSLTPGCATVAEYQAVTSYPGALVGPLANRVAGARARIGGQSFALPANEDGPTCLHSGTTGLHARVWRLAELGETSVTLTLALADGDGGLPGNRQLTARYSLPGEGILRLEISGMTDRPTAMSIANHSYWNLDGTTTWTGHSLQIAAEHWLPVEARLVPTGELAPAAGSMDFRNPRRLFAGQPALDHCFCLARSRRALAPAATLTGSSGVTMQLWTTEPGLQVYDGRAPLRPGDGPHLALALEPQGWPDAVNRPDFPSVEVTPDHPYHQISEWRLALP